MKYRTLALFSILLLAAATIPLQGKQSFSLTDDIVVAKGEVQDNVVSLGGNILIEGEVKENVVAFGGTIVVSGVVGELILGFGSEITLKSTAVVKGDLAALGGKLIKEPGSLVEGDTVYFKSSEETDKFLKEGLLGIFSPQFAPFILILKLIGIFIWLVLTVVLIGFLQRQISFASSQIQKAFWPICGIGLLSLVIFVCLVVFSALLSLILIGIPILVSLIIAGIIIKVFGKVVLYAFFGEILSKAFGWHKASPMIKAVLGVAFISLIELLPVLGAMASVMAGIIVNVLVSLFSFIVSIISWGVVVRTKFGTRENWFKKELA